MNQFAVYSDSIFNAFCLHTKSKEITDRKEDIINRVSDHYKSQPESILFVGFNPAILTIKVKEVYVTEVSQQVFEWLQAQRPAIQKLTTQRKFDYVIAFDEYLTFAESDQQQLDMIKKLCSYASKLLITTVKDYKNQDYKDREYSQPAIIRHDSKLTAYTEIHDWNTTEKTQWHSHLYKLQGSLVEHAGEFARRSLFFKQLAKFSIDAGARNFLVHKNVMYKSIIKKNYEHVISICF